MGISRVCVHVLVVTMAWISTAYAQDPTDEDTAECVYSDECVVILDTCCGPCRSNGSTGYTAVPATEVEAREREVSEICAHRDMLCQCLDFGWNENLLAVCDEGQCMLIDAGEPRYTACDSDTDCSLQPPYCCGCTEFLAVGPGFAEINELLCLDTDCEACEIPGTLTARCVDGHCTMEGTSSEDDMLLPEPE